MRAKEKYEAKKRTEEAKPNKKNWWFKQREPMRSFHCRAFLVFETAARADSAIPRADLVLDLKGSPRGCCEQHAAEPYSDCDCERVHLRAFPYRY